MQLTMTTQQYALLSTSVIAYMTCFSIANNVGSYNIMMAIKMVQTGLDIKIVLA